MTSHVEETIIVTFEHLDACLMLAGDIAPVSQPQQLVDLLPECSPPAQRLILSELVKFDMAQAADVGLIRSLDFYSEILEPLYTERQIPFDLVLEEIQIRRSSGDEPKLADYSERFPHLRAIIEEFLGRQGTRRSTKALNKPPVFQPGVTVDDFQIVRTLGQGAFASVYLARQLSIQRLVALKVSQRGSDEPLALSQLDHANVVRLYDQRRINMPDAILLYMQYVPGGTLSDTIKATNNATPDELNGKSLLQTVDAALLTAGQQLPENSTEREQLASLDWPRVVAWLGIQLAEGLAAAHERGIMHRDVKPANILLNAEGVPKLADFNVSFGGTAGGAGAAVHFGGSLAYMSPEQLRVADPRAEGRAEDLDCRSDLYSLAIVLWETWNGRRPFQPSDMFDSWTNALEQQVAMRREEPKVFRPSNSAAARVLEKVLRQTLSENRELRPRNGKELAGRLRLALNSEAAEYFEPAKNSWRARILSLPLLLVTGLIIFIPNGLAGALNYQYNLQSISQHYPQAVTFFKNLSFAINFIAFPLGIAVLYFINQPLRRAMLRARAQQPATEVGLDAAWNLGHRAAMIGGLMWSVSGVVFPLALRIAEPDFSINSAIEFFLSLVICGGFAWIYPFFGISLVATKIYYPSLVAPTMTDPELARRAERTTRRATNYLATAAAIPLLALGLLALQADLEAGNRAFLLAIVPLTAIALPFAFLAHQRILESCKTLQSVLS
ncbi:MAG: serine/threonine-protein kinase [Pirellulaceae bacterium]|nr:serine/threonine-protein kinase [Pirellulaceae bacterium]